jgi:hypothetical protein
MEQEQVEAILRRLTAPMPSAAFKKSILEEAGKRMTRASAVPQEWGARSLALAAGALFVFVIAWSIAAPCQRAAPASQAKADPPGGDSLPDLIRKFATGDEAARAEILKSGVPGVLLLRQARELAPARIDKLLFDLKKQIAGPEGEKAARTLEEKRTLKTPRGRIEFKFEDPFWNAFNDLKFNQDLPLSADPILLSRPLGDEGIPLEMGDRPGREMLDLLCVKTGIDYGFFYGRIFLSTPERLWSSISLPAVPALAKDDAERARQWVEDLNHEKPDVRAKAMEGLKKLGRAALPMLQAHARRPETKIAVGCGELIAFFSPSRGGLFGPPGAERQNLKEDDARFYKTVKDRAVGFKCASLPMDWALRLCLRPLEIPFETAPSLHEVSVIVDAQDDPVWVLLAVLCQGNGFDFMVREGTLYFGTKEEIEQRIRGDK